MNFYDIPSKHVLRLVNRSQVAARFELKFVPSGEGLCPSWASISPDQVRLRLFSGLIGFVMDAGKMPGCPLVP